MEKSLLDLYTDYLISSFGPTTATGLERLLEGEISHDQVTPFLASARLCTNRGAKPSDSQQWDAVLKDLYIGLCKAPPRPKPAPICGVKPNRYCGKLKVRKAS